MTSKILKVVKEDGIVVYEFEDGTQPSREELKADFVERGTYILKEIDTLKDDLKDIANEAEKAGFEKRRMNALTKHNHKNTIGLDIEELESIQEELDNLFSA